MNATRCDARILRCRGICDVTFECCKIRTFKIHIMDEEIRVFIAENADCFKTAKVFMKQSKKSSQVLSWDIQR